VGGNGTSVELIAAGDLGEPSLHGHVGQRLAVGADEPPRDSAVVPHAEVHLRAGASVAQGHGPRGVPVAESWSRNHAQAIAAGGQAGQVEVAGAIRARRHATVIADRLDFEARSRADLDAPPPWIRPFEVLHRTEQARARREHVEPFEVRQVLLRLNEQARAGALADGQHGTLRRPMGVDEIPLADHECVSAGGAARAGGDLDLTGWDVAAEHTVHDEANP